MANSIYRMVNYTPRMTDAEAYELLHPTVRKALQEAVTEWSSYGALRYQRKHGAKATIEWLRGGDLTAAARSWHLGGRRVGQKAEPSPAKQCRVPILRANW